MPATPHESEKDKNVVVVGSYVVTGASPMTAADRRDANDQLDLRTRLLEQREIQDQLRKLAPKRHEFGPGDENYRGDVEELSRILDGHLEPGYLDELVERLLRDGRLPSPSVALHSGNSGRKRARRRSPETIALVARSLAFRVAGTPKIRADQEAGSEFSSPDLVTKHRQHLSADSKSAQLDAFYERRWRRHLTDS